MPSRSSSQLITGGEGARPLVPQLLRVWVVPAQSWIPSGDWPWLRRARSSKVALSSWGQFMWSGWDRNARPTALDCGRTLHRHLALGSAEASVVTASQPSFSWSSFLLVLRGSWSWEPCPSELLDTNLHLRIRFLGKLTCHAMLRVWSTNLIHRKPLCRKVTRSGLWFRRSPLALDWRM